MSRPNEAAVSRRRYLDSIGTIFAGIGIAGCSGSTGGTGSDTTEAPTATTESRGSPTPSASPTETPTRTPTQSRARSPETTATAGGTDQAQTIRATGTPLFPEYEKTEVTVATPDGDVLGTVVAAIAREPYYQYVGLSDTESLPEDRGMLFVYDAVAERTFVMRNMDFGIDIVYADADGVITRVHHAPEPEPGEGEEDLYPGRGQYVLEVNYDWTTARGIETGDVLEFDL
ncbi:DUF192 domain-containing protein [Halobacteriales archaeon QS_1_68_17]|nr:MAG: DUF192 domain-containing protein [Halobacteriales archaeon QS_1_68_17]